MRPVRPIFSARATMIPAAGRTGIWSACGCTGSRRNALRVTGTWAGTSPSAWAISPLSVWIRPRTSWTPTRVSPAFSRARRIGRRRRSGSATSSAGRKSPLHPSWSPFVTSRCSTTILRTIPAMSLPPTSIPSTVRTSPIGSGPARGCGGRCCTSQAASC